MPQFNRRDRAAELAGRGLSLQEIAHEMGLSVTEVQLYLEG
jgi:predicted transcriptional regulator